MTLPANLAETHEQYPDGFPPRLDDALLGHWTTPAGVVVVEHHPHGYEIHFGPCYDFDGCDACSPDRGPANMHTDDGHDFRSCVNTRGPIITVAGGEAGYRAVLEYLSREGSEPHIRQFAALVADDEAAEAERRRIELEEEEAVRIEEESYTPTVEERFAALEAEHKALREILHDGKPTTEAD